jgi:hypothetical protein
MGLKPTLHPFALYTTQGGPDANPAAKSTPFVINNNTANGPAHPLSLLSLPFEWSGWLIERFAGRSMPKPNGGLNLLG